MGEIYSLDEMLGAVRIYLETKGYTLYEYEAGLEPARVPVFGVKKSSEGLEHQVFVDIITEPNIETSAYFRDKAYPSLQANELHIKNASSGTFYRHYFYDAEVYWAVPIYATKEGGFQDFADQCKSFGIGLIVVSKNKEEVCEANPFGEIPLPLVRERIENLLNRIQDHFSEPVTIECREEVRKVLEHHAHEDISYLAFYPEPQYRAKDISDRRYSNTISVELINRVRSLERVGYKDILRSFSATYFSERKDPFETASRVTKELWGLLGIECPDLHEQFEPILRLRPTYRDHFLHAYQVFLYGVCVIDKMYDEINHKPYLGKPGSRLEDAWLLAATYHDFTYMIEDFDRWTMKFLNGSLHLQEKTNPASLHLAETYVKEGFMFFTRDLLKHLDIAMDKVTLDFFYDRILNRKNHGLLSALSLGKYLGSKKRPGSIISEYVINSAAGAIAIHDSKIWEFLAGLKNPKDDELKGDKVGKAFNKAKRKPKVLLKQEPIAFLLNLADSVQEEGRIGARHEENGPHLNAFYHDGKRFVTEITFSGKDSGNASDHKYTEMKKVRDFLGADQSFCVRIRDTNGHTANEVEI